MMKSDIEGKTRRNTERPACPRCGGIDPVKNGTTDGKQSWRCAACHRYFTVEATRRDWSEEEIEALKTAYWEGECFDAMSDRFGRSERALRLKLTRLGVKGRKYPSWTQERKDAQSAIMKGCVPYEMTDAVRAKMKAAQAKAWADPDRRRRGIEHIKRVNVTSQPKAAAARRGQSSWNVGMHPWEWMNITEEKFYVMLAESQKRRPTKPEKVAIELIASLRLPWRYVGDGQLWIGGKNPDFVHEAEKRVLEIYGRYWHTEEEIPERQQHFAEHGYECDVLWEDEVCEEQLSSLSLEKAR